MNYRLFWAAALVACAHAQTPGIIAYTRAPEGGPPWPIEDVYTVRADGSALQALTSDGHSHHIAGADGTNDVRLTDSSTNSGSPAWSPDGKHIAFDQFTDANERQQVFIMNADGANNRQLTTDTAWSCGHPTWSPNGNQLVVACRSAASPCGMGFFSTGKPMPECTRRLCIVPVGSSAVATPTKLLDDDGAFPSFAPR